MLLLLIVGLSTGCARPRINHNIPSPSALAAEQQKQQTDAILRYLAMKQRIADISWQLMTSIVARCPNRQRYSLGLRLHNPAKYDARRKAAISALYGDTDSLQLLYSAEGSPAALQLKAGDQLLTLDNKPLPKDPELATALLRRTLDKNPVQLRLKRDQQSISVSLTPVKTCDYPVYLSSSDSINAWADGDDITLNAGLLRFTRDDAALAMIIAHELAHNTLRHIDKRLYNGTLGLLLDIALSSTTGITSPAILGGLSANMYSQEFEIEADIAALEMIHQAGFDIRQVAGFWRRVGAEHPATIHSGRQRSHPTSAERYLILKQQTEELLDKRASDDKNRNAGADNPS